MSKRGWTSAGLLALGMWLMILTAVVLLSGCSTSSHARPVAPGQTTTARSINLDPLHGTAPVKAALVIDALRAHGYAVTNVHPADTTIWRESVDVTIDGDESGINTFNSVADRDQWKQLASMLGGIAAIGPTWAVSLDSQGVSATVARSDALAKAIAAALHVDHVTWF